MMVKNGWNYIVIMKIKNEDISLKVIQTFCQNLRNIVSDSGLSPYALAVKAGFNKDAVRNVMSGSRDPRLSTVIQVVKGLNLSFDSLLNIDPDTVINSISLQQSLTALKITKNKINLFNKIATVHEQDIELLEGIIDLLEKRKIRAMTNLLNTVRNKKLTKKECLMDKIIENLNESNVKDTSNDDYDDDSDDDDLGELDDENYFNEEDSSDDYDEDDLDDEDYLDDEGEDTVLDDDDFNDL
jgi:predicted transcriptional regulator